MFRCTLMVTTTIASCILLSGCSQTAQPPQISAEPARPSIITPTDEAISGDVLNSCFKDAPKIFSKIHEGSVARYSEFATNRLAVAMRNSPDDIPQYADQVRGYIFDYEAKFLGTRQVHAICYYGKTSEGLKFAHRIVADEVGRVSRDALIGAVMDVYKSLSGKSLSFGKSALLSMMINP